ncbi:hypothetical protein BC936DRAFT_139037 [Jimgerdemannia flammicorona]|uniref:Uncharacterized protein n=1 Tax=Jimgerdemannia flammicorona TaxID=994334 RepID=A0A433BAT5_9FUNG|nr:hypothetical protein BC936DRAFT_139037 [Jimgerdemannia flammicorona]
MVVALFTKHPLFVIVVVRFFRMPPKFRLTEKLRECLYYPDYWDRDPNLWGDVVDWDIYFAKKMPSCTPRDSHMALSVDLDLILEEISTDNFAYRKALVLRATLKVKYFSVTNSWQRDMCYAPRLRSTAQ